jgi:hypothetical protein
VPQASVTPEPKTASVAPERGLRSDSSSTVDL